MLNCVKNNETPKNAIEKIIQLRICTKLTFNIYEKTRRFLNNFKY